MVVARIHSAFTDYSLAIRAPALQFSQFHSGSDPVEEKRI
jgi:hypothetical protein